MTHTIGHLQALESESIHILREVAASFERPVMLWSIGKDSSVLLRLAQKAFHPGPIPFPLLHVDTSLKFPEMYAFRERMAAEVGFRLIVERNEAGICKLPAEFSNPAKVCGFCSRTLKTEGLLKALSKYRFDAAIGGARREEERSRAKERVFSFRDEFGAWDPKSQRPELWNIYNTRVHEGESIRVFPLSNWTESDIWQYIRREAIPIVPLYFAAEREVVERGGVLLSAQETRLLAPGEVPKRVMCRFRTLGCMTCTGAVLSSAVTLDEIVAEALAAKRSERETRLVDQGADSMEDKKKDGYF